MWFKELIFHHIFTDYNLMLHGVLTRLIFYWIFMRTSQYLWMNMRVNYSLFTIFCQNYLPRKYCTRLTDSKHEKVWNNGIGVGSAFCLFALLRFYCVTENYEDSANWMLFFAIWYFYANKLDLAVNALHLQSIIIVELYL